MELTQIVTSVFSRRSMWSTNQSAKRNSKGVQGGGKASKKRQTKCGKSLRTNQREKRAGKRRSLGMESTQFVTSAFSRRCVNQRRGIQREFKGNSVTRIVYFLVAMGFLVARICHILAHNTTSWSVELSINGIYVTEQRFKVLGKVNFPTYSATC